MTLKHLLLLALTVVCSVEPIEVVVTYHNLTGLVAADGRYKVVSHNEIVETSQGRLLLKHLNGTLISEADLGYRPDELYAHRDAHSFDVIHVVAVAHAEQSSLNKVSYCRYYATRDPGLICRAGQRFRPPTKFVVSILVDENSVSVRAIYFYNSNQAESEYRVRNLIAESDEPFEFPANCTCSNHSNCLKQDDEPNGRVIVQCDSGASYLYGLNSQFFYVSLPNIKQVATTSYKNMIFVVQPGEGQFQDTLIETNMAMDSDHAAVRPLPGVFANSSNPATIQDVAIVSVNETSQLEVCFFIKSNEILYFQVVDLGINPEIKHLPRPTGLISIANRGNFDSSIAVEGIYSNGSLVLMIIEVRTDPLNNNAGSNSPPLSPSYPTSCTPQDHNTELPQSHATNEPEPRATDKPQPTNITDDTVNSARDYSNSSVVMIAVGTFFAGVILTLVSIVLLMLLCRLRKSFQSRDYNIEMEE